MLEIKKRTSGKYNADIKTEDIYKYYLNNIKPIESLGGGKTTGAYKIKQKEFASIIKDINKRVIEIIVTENFEFKIPCRLGLISMKQSKVVYKLDENGELKVKNLSIDFKATKDLWLADEEARINKNVVYHTNEHTNGNRMAYWWKKTRNCVFGINVYYFLPSRYMKRTPSKFLKDKDLKLMFYEQKTKDQINQTIYNNKNKV